MARVLTLDRGIRVRLAPYARHGAAPLALADADVGGCAGVQLSVRGRLQPPLESSIYGGGGLLEELDRVLGLKVNTAPPFLNGTR